MLDWSVRSQWGLSNFFPPRACFIITSAIVIVVCLSVCLSVCLLATLRKNFQMDLHEIFREGWQWASEQMIILVVIRITDPNLDPHRDTGKTCLGGGVRMHCPSASSYRRIET